MGYNKKCTNIIDKKKQKKDIRKMKRNKSRSHNELINLNLGSNNTQYATDYSPNLLEVFDNKNPHAIAWTTFVCTEFTSLCPKTGQPDFARIYINYIADKKMVESKSLKLYLFSFRNHGDFHEDCVQKICDDLNKIMKPKFIEVIGEFTPRGGISIFPYASSSNNTKEFKKLKTERFNRYAPGAYSMPVSRIYS